MNTREYGIIYLGDIMKNYKVTNRGKIILTVYIFALIGSYLLNPVIFYVLSGILIVFLGIEITIDLINALKKNNKSKIQSVEKKETTEDYDASIKDADEKKEAISQDKKLEKNDKNHLIEDVIEVNNEEDFETIEDDFKSIEEDIELMEKDLKAIGKKATTLQKDSIETYYQEKKSEIAKDIDKKRDKVKEEITQSFEEESLLDNLLEKMKTLFSFKKYKKGNLVLHKHFGIGKIINAEDTLKVSFINDQLEEIIDFEYDKQNKIPELNLFKAPKGEDERQYYYNYKKDISDELLKTIEKIDLNLPDIKYQWNVFLKSGLSYEKYDFIAISDQVHVFCKKNEDQIESKILVELLKDYELEIKIHEVSDYTSINSILLKSKIKGVIPFEVMNTVDQMIEESNIKDFNERMQFLERS